MNRHLALRITGESPCNGLIGVGGIGTGLFFALEGDHTLGRNESRPGRLLGVRDFCKLHIISHYVAVLLGADPSGEPFLVLPIGRVGCDDAGRRMLEEMARAGMDVRFVDECPDLPTTLSICFQYPDGSGGNITTSHAAASSLNSRDLGRAFAFAERQGRRWVALAAPEVPLPVRAEFLRAASGLRAFRVAAFASAEVHEAVRCGFIEMLDLIALNQDEAATAGGVPLDPKDPAPFLARCGEVLRGINPRIRVVVTAGPLGAFALDGDSWSHCPAPDVPVASTAGAGDALLGGLLAGLAAGLPLTGPRRSPGSFRDQPIGSALDLAVLLASYTVMSPHTIHPEADLDHLAAFAETLGVRLDRRVERALTEDANGGEP
jgi:sugar/nucleoside kinase (ribokinase family)